MHYQEKKEEVAYFMRRLYENQLTTCSGGNISLKLSDNLILVTPTKLDKARLKPENIVEITTKGKILSKGLKPTSETPIHISIYKKRPDVKAIIHAHPVAATSFACSKKNINLNFTPESRIILNKVVRSPFKMMWSEELGDEIAKSTLEGDVILMENHGTLTVGKSLLEAFDKTEVLETAAKMTLYTNMLKSQCEIDPKILKKIDIAAGINN